MKKVILITSIICFSVALKAQGVKFGIKAGANINKLSGVSFSDAYNLSYQAGGFFEIDFSKKIGIQPEILFSQSQTNTVSGFNSIYNGLASAVSGTSVKYNQLSIPILLRYNVGKLLTVNLGPQYSILMNQSETLLNNGKEAFKNGDFALVSGLQLNLGTLRIYGRYNIGLNNLNDIDNKDQWKSQQLQLGFGFKF
ncbi:MAG: porin family protein [Chitinophagaceae bacterium]